MPRLPIKSPKDNKPKLKNFAKADAIRDELNRQGIELEDGRMGMTWRRI